MGGYSVSVVVTNDGPTLMHKFSAYAGAEISKTVTKVKSGPPDPIVEAEQGSYRITPKEGDPVWGKDAPEELVGKQMGQLALPAEHWYQSMFKAASGFRVQGQGKKTYKDAVGGNLLIGPEYVPLCDQSGKPLFYYEIDARPVRIQRSRIMRHRPLLKEWVAEFTLTVLDSVAVSFQNLNAILVAAGQTKGVGDYRPRFGRFTVIGFDKGAVTEMPVVPGLERVEAGEGEDEEDAEE